MKRYIWSGNFAALVLAAAVGVTAQSSSPSQKPAEPTAQPPAAQEPAPAPQPPTTAPEPAAAPAKSDEARHITVAGCLQPAPSAPIATSGSAAAAPSAATDKAEKPSDEAKLMLTNAVSSPADPAASASGSTAPVTYRLIANEASLTPHIGKKLELSGTIEASSPTASASDGPMLRVESGKVLTESCTQ